MGICMRTCWPGDEVEEYTPSEISRAKRQTWKRSELMLLPYFATPTSLCPWIKALDTKPEMDVPERRLNSVSANCS